MLLGIYEIDHRTLGHGRRAVGLRDGAVPGQTDRIENELTLGFERYPDLCRRWASRPGSTAPSPSRPTATRWSARCAASRLLVRLRGDGGLPAGRRRGQVAGRMDDPRRTGGRRVFGMDVARYGPYAENKRIHPPDHGPVLFPPLRDDLSQRAAAGGRPLKMAPAYSAMTEAGCRWGAAGDLEVPLYFAPKDFEETPSLKRSNAHSHGGRGMQGRARRRGPSGYHRLLALRGVGAERRKLARPADGLQTARNRAAPGWPMLGRTGKLKGDLTCSTGAMAPGGSWAATTCANGTCAGSTTTWQDGVTVRDLGDEMAGLLPGRSEIPRGDRKADRWPGGRAALHGLRPVRHRADALQGGRMSVAGELGYEITAGWATTLRCAGRCWRRARTSASRIRLQRAPRCGWRRASASGRGVHPRLHGRARPAWTAGSTGTRATSSAAMRRWPSGTATARAGS
jgi:dimethylglycine dehydrogenase